MQEEEEKFSDDPMEHFRIENEILKMKLKAQFGDAFEMFTEGEPIPADIENQFLKNMIEFEENYQNAEFETIAQKLGNPQFKKTEDCNRLELQKAIQHVNQMLEQHQIQVDFIYKNYSDEIIYRFLSEELMQKEIEKGLPEGAICNFVYEDFHPNHAEELKKLTFDFVINWVTQNAASIEPLLAEVLMDAEANSYSKEQVYQKINHYFDSFHHFQNDGFNIDEVKFELNTEEDNEESESGIGHGEGVLRFEAVMENGEVIVYEGPYKIYFMYQLGSWNAFYFVMPGFQFSTKI